MLFRYWIVKFARIFLIAVLALGIIERIKSGGAADYLSVLMWSAAAAILTASLSTWWAYKKSCGLPPR